MWLVSKKSVFGSLFQSLQSRNYRIYFIGQSVSLIGTWMQNTALSWLVYRLTGSLLLLGITGFANQIPIFVLSPVTGVLTDKFNKGKVMQLAQILFLIQASIIAFLVLSGYIQVWHIILLSIFFGIISAIDAPARQSMVIDLIDNPAHLGNAIALNSAIFNGARLIGPAIAGLTIKFTGEGICFIINALSYVSIIVALFFIKSRPKSAKKIENLKTGFSEGFKYTFGFAPVRIAITVLAVISLSGISFTVLMPAYAKEILHGNAGTLGFLLSASGAGALAGALFMAFQKTVMRLSRLITLHIIFMGVSIIIISVSKSYFLSIIGLMGAGLSMIISVASINTLIQSISAENMRGRVMSFYAMALMGTTPIGNLLAGTIAHELGIKTTLIIGAGVTIIAALWFNSKKSIIDSHLINLGKNKL